MSVPNLYSFFKNRMDVVSRAVVVERHDVRTYL
jgi:hypothetical protein